MKAFRSKVRAHYSVTLVLLLATGQSIADSIYELQLIHPDSNVSSQPFIEFRSRKYDIDPRKDPALFAGRFSPGHGFVLLGRVLDDGTLFYHSVGGFYPEPHKLGNVLIPMPDFLQPITSPIVQLGRGIYTSIRSSVNIANGHGEVTYKLPDLEYDQVFRAPITREQEVVVQGVLRNWDAKEYALVGRNCANMMADVARVVGLDPGRRKTLDTPWEVLETLLENNSIDHPLKAAVKQKTENQKERVRINRDIYNRERKRLEKERELRYEQQLRDSIQDSVGGLINRSQGNRWFADSYVGGSGTSDALASPSFNGMNLFGEFSYDLEVRPYRKTSLLPAHKSEK